MSRSGPALQATAKEGNALETTQQAPRRQTRADTRFQRESARILGEIKSLDQSTEMLVGKKFTLVLSSGTNIVLVTWMERQHLVYLV